MAIDPEEVRHIAELSRVDLDDDEVARLGGDLERIVDYIDQIKTVELPPDAESLTYFDADVHRKDRPCECLERDDALRNAPEEDGTYFLVPKVVERDEE
ncbi:MAG: Asp-tRNA(Asn)/Glu-tRNA(Gln) amidotransferase subunit GatC [Planctomycetota bacterium]|jgi:aspartyl-tRNA(Asn)/glutamyl-tRNA(Gln) amidotransferase subunit C|nr:Asp-tRNA(Asn)/Glu-tRNA(Gln) amidotransferase subunit GatC [Planctomycetota bacterium]